MTDPPDTDNLLLAYVGGRDVECPTCRYNVRDLKSPVCPECGERLVLRLQAVKPRVGVLIAGLLPMAMALGFIVSLLLYALWARLSWGDWLWDDATELVLMLTLVATLSVSTWLWASRWSRVRVWKPQQRSVLLLAFWLMSVGSVVAIFAVIG